MTREDWIEVWKTLAELGYGVELGAVTHENMMPPTRYWIDVHPGRGLGWELADLVRLNEQLPPGLELTQNIASQWRIVEATA